MDLGWREVLDDTFCAGGDDVEGGWRRALAFPDVVVASLWGKLNTLFWCVANRGRASGVGRWLGGVEAALWRSLMLHRG